ncbi:hypothetical protein [Acinetobacter bereziniae]|uniref:hypothetical protein n=1 Tax=Acinetobacter bereziniae TaxID=106648 RepID=UPI001250570A|nr:hypothetical protein [Acinetobacter bereziniae]
MSNIKIGDKVFLNNSINDLMDVVSIDEKKGLAECKIEFKNEYFTGYLPLSLLENNDYSEVPCGSNNSDDD